MLHHRPTVLIATVALACAAITAGCSGGSSDKKTATPGAGATSVTTRTSTQTAPTPSIDLRSLDLSQDRDVAALVEDTGGVFSAQDVMFSDLTDDGVDEAIVPIGSGGTAGNIAFVVLRAVEGQVVVLLKESPSDQTSLAVEVMDGKLLMTQPVPGPEDPLCCPSFLRHTTYHWNGYAMAIESVTTDPNPNGGTKGTPSVPLTPQEPASTPAAGTTAAPPALAPEGTAASVNPPRPPAPGTSP